MNLSYLPLEIKLALINWMVNILQYCVHQLPTQAKRNVWIIDINGYKTIKSQSVLYEINRHQNPPGKSKVNIGLC